MKQLATIKSFTAINVFILVAERVVKNSPHTVMGQQLNVVLAEEQPPQQDLPNLLLKNIPPGTNVEVLKYWIDDTTDLSADDGDYQLLPKPGNLYLIVFTSALSKLFVCRKFKEL